MSSIVKISHLFVAVSLEKAVNWQHIGQREVPVQQRGSELQVKL